MSKFRYSDSEKEINRVLHYQDRELRSIAHLDMNKAETSIAQTEALLAELGYGVDDALALKSQLIPVVEKKTLTIPSWSSLCKDARKGVSDGEDLETLFSEDELLANRRVVRGLNQEYKEIHRLDEIDVALSVFAGLIGAATDFLMVGIPERTATGLAAKPLSNFIREQFDKIFPAEEMEKLANSKISKVPFDAQDNRNTTVRVEGLSAYYHRLLSLGHDPLLGFVVGVFDIMTGRMTTIDKAGRIVSQVMPNYADRTEKDVFAALAKQVIHFKSDITTSMGLPAPLMGLFNLFQFGSIGEAEQTVAEIVQGMYYEGYDFIHFCTLSIPIMLTEVIVRIGYALKRIKGGYSIKESLPLSLNREKHPKLAPMLFTAHSAATAMNAGKVAFTRNPMAINYPQWIAFARYSYLQLKWGIRDKPDLQDKYVLGVIHEELTDIFDMADILLAEMSQDKILIID